uniref:Uncharacterized protein n=1 Tax=Avena sativa TaxID=4498 RepID=A0ACD5WJL2_AVESA
MDGFIPGGSAAAGGVCCEMGGGACESCALWWEHYYSNHMSDDQKQFLVVASGDFRHSMRIRPEVASHLRNMIPKSELVKLEAPNGRVYPVEVSWELDIIVLRSGWNEFVNANHIEENNSILFVYRGNSCFKVHVFNSAGHAKSLSCSPLPSGISGPVPPFAPVKTEQVVPNPGHVNSTDSGYTMLPGCCLTKAQDEKVLEIAHTMRSKIPLYVAAMSKSNISLKNCYVYIPLRLVDSFKEEITKDTVQLQGPERTVCVGASKHSYDQIVLESGWNTFVASHHIQENDLLVFRRMETTRLQVRILDPSGREKTSSCSTIGNRSSSAQEMCDDSVQFVDPPPPQIIDLSSSDEDDIMTEGTRESCRAQKRVTPSCAKAQKIASTSSPSTEPGYEPHKTHDPESVKLGVVSESPSNNLGGPSQRPYILAQGAILSLQMERKVEEKVHTIRSELPIYVKVMTTGSVYRIGMNLCGMVFCAEYVSAACLPQGKRSLLLQMEGETKLWSTTLSIMRNKVSRIYIGWKEFAQQNGLEVGDICLFKLADRDTKSLKMTVYLIRKSDIEPQLTSV